jgi:hypothetical protein
MREADVRNIDPGAAFAGAFTAAGPRPELADRLGMFAPLIGSWALQVFDYGPGELVLESTAEWHFTWALDGRAVADVWINPSRADRGPDADGEWGLSDLTADSFNWRAEETGPDGVTVVRQRFVATRLTPD